MERLSELSTITISGEKHDEVGKKQDYTYWDKWLMHLMIV